MDLSHSLDPKRSFLVAEQILSNCLELGHLLKAL
jgi:hypothetical protein